MTMSNSDSRKRLAEAAGPAQDVETLAEVMRSAGMEVGSVNGQMFREHVARAVLAAGYLPPAEVARLVQEARKVALWEAGVQVGSKRSNPGESEDYRRGFREAIDWAMSGVQGLPREMSIADSAASAVRPVPGERSEAGA